MILSLFRWATGTVNKYILFTTEKRVRLDNNALYDNDNDNENNFIKHKDSL